MLSDMYYIPLYSDIIELQDVYSILLYSDYFRIRCVFNTAVFRHYNMVRCLLNTTVFRHRHSVKVNGYAYEYDFVKERPVPVSSVKKGSGRGPVYFN